MKACTANHTTQTVRDDNITPHSPEPSCSTWSQNSPKRNEAIQQGGVNCQDAIADNEILMEIEATPPTEAIQQGGADCQDAIAGTMRTVQYTPTVDNEQKPLQFLQDNRAKLVQQLQEGVRARRGIKWSLCVKIQYRKYKINPDEDEKPIPPSHRRTKCLTAIPTTDIEQEVDDAFKNLMISILEFTLEEGSNLVIDHLIKLDLRMATYQPVAGRSYLPLPEKLANKKAIVNVQNKDNNCFLWSVLAGLHPARKHSERVSWYRPYLHTLKYDHMPMPVISKDLRKFEKENHLAINVFGYDKHVYPLYITDRRDNVTHINLLLITRGESRHYCLIKNLDRLLSGSSKNEHRKYHCLYCLYGYTTRKLKQDHQPICGQYDPQYIEYPKGEAKWLKFTGIFKQLRIPYVIYADFETMPQPISGCNRDPINSYTEKRHYHEPCGYSYTVVGLDADHSKPAVVYRGPDVIDHFLEDMVKEESEILQKLNEIKPMKLTPEDWRQFYRARDCHICQKPLKGRRVRDHCHVTGAFRGAAHNTCNINYNFKKRIPVFFHNLRGFDSHLIMQGLGKYKERKLECIPNNMEKYISFTFDKLVFLDSLQFLSESLGNLVENLAAEGDAHFHALKRHFPAHLIPLLLRKGVYPYAYMNHLDKFAETSLPPKEAFNNDLNGEAIGDEDYQHAETIWEVFAMKSMGDYHDLYLKTDTLLLADVFEHFRDVCMASYDLDPCHYYTAPGLAWDACLKMTGIQLELLTDPDMHLFVERGIRGGISTISNRYSRANNPYLPSHDPVKPSKYITFLDANNLYGWAMSAPLPTHGFTWLSKDDIQRLDILQIADDSPEGYILDVDLGYPAHLHDLHNDYPLAPEHLEVTSDMTSRYSQHLFDKMKLRSSATVKKLIPNLYDKSHYIIHYRNLKFYLEQGMQLKTIHRVLAFQQSPWLEPYIRFNTEKRKCAANTFEKNFYKLLNNSVFGKAIENLRNRQRVELVHTPQRLKKLIAKPNVLSFRAFNPDLAAVHLRKKKLCFNRPLYVGFSILEVSKILMYDFHYNHVKVKYGQGAKLLITDTDSLCYEIQTDDVYTDMQQDAHLYDFSDYPRSHFLYDTTNKKVLGKMKDETAGVPPEEFVGLKSKMYSLQCPKKQDAKDFSKKTGKGIKKSTINRDIVHNHYRQCLLEESFTMAQMNQIRSYDHQLYTIQINKIGLSPYDDKRYVLDNGCDTLAYGHYSLQQ